MQPFDPSSTPTHLKKLKAYVLSMLPSKHLKDFLNYQQHFIQQSTCFSSLMHCFNSYQYKNINESFRLRFQAMSAEERREYYAKILKITLGIVDKKTRLPDSNAHLDDSVSTEQIEIRFKVGSDWQCEKMTINYCKKTIESQQYKFDLHFYFLQKRKEYYISIAVLKPMLKDQPAFEFTFANRDFEELFQRLERLIDDCLEENMIKIIEGECKIVEHESNEEMVGSERRSIQSEKCSIKLRESRTLLRNNQENAEVVDYLKIQHPTAPVENEAPRNLLIPSQDVHYLLTGEFKINQDGQLVVCNQEKIAAQSNVLKYIIKRVLSGTKVFSISLPVQIFGSQSNLSLLVSSFRFAPLILELASKSDALERFKQVIRFSLTCPACYICCDKPWNPILGETYQRIIDGTVFTGEQISHHPPISAAFIKGKGYTLYGCFQADVEFGINSVTGNNKGWVKVSFDEHDNSQKVVRFTNSPGEMSGLIFGKRTLNLINSVYYIDEQNYLFCQLFYGKIKFQQKVKTFKDSIQGKIVRLRRTADLTKPELITQKDIESYEGLIHGQWLSNVYFNDQLLINTRKEYPSAIDSYQGLLQSDYSFRQDITLRMSGPSEQCQLAKEKLEQQQRQDRKLRESSKK